MPEKHVAEQAQAAAVIYTVFTEMDELAPERRIPWVWLHTWLEWGVGLGMDLKSMTLSPDGNYHPGAGRRCGA